MNKKEKENKLIANAETELQKTQQLVESEFVQTQLQKFIDNKMQKDIIIRDDLLKDNREVSDTLLNRIDGREEVLNSIQAELGNTETQIHSSISVSNQAIAELRKISPLKASEIENRIRMKVKKSSFQSNRKNKF